MFFAKRIAIVSMAGVMVLGCTGCGVAREIANAVENEIVEETVEDTVDEIEDIDEEITEEISDEPMIDEGNASITNSTLSAEVQTALASLDTDYGKICWGAQYSISENMPGVVVSVTPCYMYGDTYGLVVAITNLYDESVYFQGSAGAYNTDGAIIGDTYVYCPCIGPANTVINIISCSDNEMPDGRIHWEDVKLDMETVTDTYVPWEADYSVSDHIDDGYLSVDYSIYASNGMACQSDELSVFLLDENGYVIAVGSDYISGIGEGEKSSGTIDIYSSEGILQSTRSIAMFGNFIAE